MKRVQLLWLFVVLGSACPNIYADAQTSHGLSLVTKFESKQIPPSTNGPIWLTLTVKAEGTSTFSGGFFDLSNWGVIGTRSPVTAAKMQLCVDRTKTDVLVPLFTLNAGETKVFHVLLNDLISVSKQGNQSGWVILPLKDGSTQPAAFALVAPFSVNVGPPLSHDQLSTITDQLIDSVETYDFEVRQDTLRSISLLPDGAAIPLLSRAIRDRQAAPFVGDLVDALGNRSRTPDDIKALQDIAQSSDLALSTRAKGFLNTGGGTAPAPTAP